MTPLIHSLILTVLSLGWATASLSAKTNIGPEKSGDKTRPVAWLQFNRHDKGINHIHDRWVHPDTSFFYDVSRATIQVEMQVAPHPAHQLAVRWIPKDDKLPARAMTIEINGERKVVAKPSGTRKEKPYWFTIPVTEFGIDAPEQGRTYKITVSKAESNYGVGLFGGLAIISDSSQLKFLRSAKGRAFEDRNTKFISPGRITPKVIEGEGRMNVKRNDPVDPPKLHEVVDSDKYLTAAAHFADAWLSYGVDNYGFKKSPLFADMVDSETLTAPRIGVAFDRNGLNKDMIISDMAGHQNFLRTLESLTRLTGVAKYRKAGQDAVRYMFDNYQTSSGMLVWGEHYFVDLYTERPVQTKGALHEMKGYYPYYEFLYRVEPDKTKLMMEGIWAAHISWQSLAFGRHGGYKARTLDGSIWDKPWKDPGIDYYTGSLSFSNSGFELVNGALQVGILSNDSRVTQWGQRLLYQFVRQANPDTHLIAYHLYHPTKDRRHDRLLKTFGRTYPTAREKNVYIQGGGAMTRTVGGVLATYLEMCKDKKVELPEELRRALDRDIDGIRRHLVGYFKHVYNPKKHRLRYMVTDGTDLTGFKVTNSTKGYGARHVGPVKDGWVPMSIFPSYSMGLKIFPDDRELWNALRTLLKNEGVGDIGSFDEKKPTINRQTQCDYSEVIFTLVDLYEISGNRQYLDFADVIAENIYQNRYDPESGLFKKDVDHLLAQIDAYEPLAFITLWAAKHGRLDEVPRYNTGGRCTLGSKLIFTGYGRLTPKPGKKNSPSSYSVGRFSGYSPGKWMQRNPALLRDANIPEGYKEELRRRWNLTYPLKE